MNSYACARTGGIDPPPTDGALHDAAGDTHDAVVDTRPAIDAAKVMDSALDDASGADLASDAPSQRVTGGLQALYTFEEGRGRTIRDVSGVIPALDMTLFGADDPTWIPGGVALTEANGGARSEDAVKITAACAASGEVTIEAWIRPAATSVEGFRRIASLSANKLQRNITLGQGSVDCSGGSDSVAVYATRIRLGVLQQNGCTSTMQTPDGDAAYALTHVLVSRDSSGIGVTYINGEFRAGSSLAGSLDSWANYPLTVGNEVSLDRTWLGEIYLLAIYSRALSVDEVAANFAAGPDGA